MPVENVVGDRVALFLDKPVIRAFIARAHTRALPARHTIIHAGDEPQSVYLILEGSVSITLEDPNGREIVLAYLTAGSFFGEMCLFPDQPRRSAIVTSRSPTRVAELGYQPFNAFVMENPLILYEVAGQLAARLRDTSRRLGDLASLDTAGRLANVLLGLCQTPDALPHPRGTVITLPRTELARIVNCSREMIGRGLRVMEENGTVQMLGRSILVLGEEKGKRSLLKRRQSAS